MDRSAIERLPDLCLRKIFGYLDGRDLARCRRVCGLFKFYVNQIATLELVVREPTQQPTERDQTCRWHLSDRPIEGDDAISWQAFESLRTSRPRLRQQLTFLWIDRFQATYSNGQLLNAFQELVHLEISNWCGRSTVELALPNLRALSIHYLDGGFVTASTLGLLRTRLKTPRLEVLRSDHVQAIAFEYPETIKRLECDDDKQALEIVLTRFKSLEVFRCEAWDLMLDRVLPVKDQLKKLDLRLNIIEERTYTNFRRFLLNEFPLGKQLKIYLNDVLLVYREQLANYEIMKNDDHLIKFHLRNYKLFAGRRLDVTHINYNDLLKVLVTNPSSEFFEKFPSIRAVEVTGPVDFDQFASFVKNTSNLRELKLTKCFSNALVNFRFLMELPSLCSFVTDLPVQRALLLGARLFERIASFEEFESKTPWNKSIVIRRDPSAKGRFELSFLENDATRTVSFHATNQSWADLVGFCKNRV